MDDYKEKDNVEFSRMCVLVNMQIEYCYVSTFSFYTFLFWWPRLFYFFFFFLLDRWLARPWIL